jgi:hypothetical protein
MRLNVISAVSAFGWFTLILDPSPAGRGRQQAHMSDYSNVFSQAPTYDIANDGGQFPLSQRERAGRERAMMQGFGNP